MIANLVSAWPVVALLVVTLIVCAVANHYDPAHRAEHRGLPCSIHSTAASDFHCRTHEVTWDPRLRPAGKGNVCPNKGTLVVSRRVQP